MKMENIALLRCTKWKLRMNECIKTEVQLSIVLC